MHARIVGSGRIDNHKLCYFRQSTLEDVGFKQQPGNRTDALLSAHALNRMDLIYCICEFSWIDEFEMRCC